MSYTSNINLFFQKNIYNNLPTIALSPVLWMAKPVSGMHFATPDFARIFLGIALWPVLLPVTITTYALSMSIGVSASIVQQIALVGAAGLDAIYPEIDTPEVNQTQAQAQTQNDTSMHLNVPPKNKIQEGENLEKLQNEDYQFLPMKAFN